jgi:hypothetical protein
MDEQEYNSAIQDWLAIIDYEDKAQTKWCRDNITSIRKSYRINRKGKNLA